jgi:hypothetical protein
MRASHGKWEMEWFATQWVIMPPASSSDEGVMEMRPQNIRLVNFGPGHRRYWREIIQFNASEFGGEFSEIGGKSSSATPLNSVMNSVIR